MVVERSTASSRTAKYCADMRSNRTGSVSGRKKPRTTSQENRKGSPTSRVPAHGIQLVGPVIGLWWRRTAGVHPSGPTLLDSAMQENVLKDAQLWISGATPPGGRSCESCYWLDRMYFFLRIDTEKAGHDTFPSRSRKFGELESRNDDFALHSTRPALDLAKNQPRDVSTARQEISVPCGRLVSEF